MSCSAQALVVYDSRMQNPPAAFIFMEMLHNIIVIEETLPHAPHPRDVNRIAANLRHMFATMHYLADWTLCRRVLRLLNRARYISDQLSHQYVRQCAELVAACHIHRHM